MESLVDREIGGGVSRLHERNEENFSMLRGILEKNVSVGVM